MAVPVLLLALATVGLAFLAALAALRLTASVARLFRPQAKGAPPNRGSSPATALLASSDALLHSMRFAAFARLRRCVSSASHSNSTNLVTSFVTWNPLVTRLCTRLCLHDFVHAVYTPCIRRVHAVYTSISTFCALPLYVLVHGVYKTANALVKHTFTWAECTRVPLTYSIPCTWCVQVKGYRSLMTYMALYTLCTSTYTPCTHHVLACAPHGHVLVRGVYCATPRRLSTIQGDCMPLPHCMPLPTACLIPLPPGGSALGGGVRAEEHTLRELPIFVGPVTR
jgi:hypothetical protein